MKRTFFAVALGLFALSASEAWGIKREDLIAEAITYRDHSWTCRSANLQDTNSNDVDDRGDWPFEMDGVYVGEAYAWVGQRNDITGVGWGWEPLSTFQARLSSPNEKWIAGSRPEDVKKLGPPLNEPFPSGYKGYTGIDCSGFVSRMWHTENWPNLNRWHLGTGELPFYSEEINKDDLRPGDILIRPVVDDGHVVVFKEWVTPGTLARIIHASSTDYETGQKVWRVNEDLATVSGAVQAGTIGVRSENGYTPMTAFPRIQNVSPIRQPKPKIKADIGSATPIIASSIFLKLESATQSITIPNSALTITPGPGNLDVVVEYQVTDADALADGTNTLTVYAANEINLEETETQEFVVDAMPPAKPTSLKGRAGNGRAKFTWATPTTNEDGSLLADLAGYRLRYSTNPSDATPNVVPADGGLIPLSGGSSESYELAGLTNGGIFYVTVTAVDAVGNESARSQGITVRPEGNVLWVHKKDGPSGSYATLYDALANAGPGKTIMVGEGVYRADGLFIEENDVRLRSERGPERTIIDGSESAAEFLVRMGDGASVIGFTIRNQENLGEKRGIVCVLRNDVLIANNVFLSNDVGIMLGGAGDDGESIRIYNNVFAGNTYGVVTDLNYVNTFASNNIFVGNATGLRLDFSAMSDYRVASNMRVDHNDFSGNVEDFEYPEVFDFYREHNIANDPDFVSYDPGDPSGSDYHLSDASPCWDAGARNRYDAGKRWEDCDGSPADLGAYGGPYAYFDGDGNGVPDCQQPWAVSSVVKVLKNSAPVPVTLGGRSPQEGALTYSIIRWPAHGTLAGGGAEWTYAVDQDYEGPDDFEFRVNDSAQDSNAVVVSIEVKATNSGPQAPDQEVKVAPSPNPVLFTLAGGDPDGDHLTYTFETVPTVGTFICDDPPVCWYAPAENFIGATSFAYRVSDGISESAPGAVTIIVNNDPVLTHRYPGADEIWIAEDASQLFQVGVEDVDASQVLTYSWSVNGVAVGNADRYALSPSHEWIFGGPILVRVEVSDGLAVLEESWTVHVKGTFLADDGVCVLSPDDPNNPRQEWTQATSGTGYLGGSYLVHTPGSGASSATWSVSLPAAGTYKVYARWPALSTNDATAIYRVTYAGGAYDDLSMDQTTDGGQWNLLGTYAFDTTGEVRVSAADGDRTVADAVRFVATEDPADIILDDLAGDGFGTWSTGSGGFRGEHRTADGGTGQETFTWTPDVVAPGTWDLLARWKIAPGGAPDAKYVVWYEGIGEGLRNTQHTVDQTVANNRWNPLGTLAFESTDHPAVQLSDNATGTVVADAVKLVYRGSQLATIVDNAGPAFEVSPNAATWPASTAIAGYLGTNYRQAATGSGGTAKWTLPITVPGNYEIYARWTSAPDRSPSARYEIRRLGLANPAVVLADQRTQGGAWQYLGRFEFDAMPDHEQSVTLLQGAGETVVADAVLCMKTDEDLPLVLDNAGPSFTRSTGWSVPSQLVPGHWGASYLQTTTSGAWAQWSPTIETAGNYEVFARWTSAADRSTSVPYAVTHDGGDVTTVTKKQTQNGGTWVSLGRHYQPAGPASVRVTAGSDVTVADAVRFDYTIQPTSIDIDDGDGDVPDTCFVQSGTWNQTATLSGFWGDAGYKTQPAGGTGVIRWTPDLPLRGYYGVYAWWPTANDTFATNAPYTITHALSAAAETRVISQRVNGGKWNYLGTYLFDAGEGGYVELTGAGADGRVIADAVRFVAEGD